MIERGREREKEREKMFCFVNLFPKFIIRNSQRSYLYISMGGAVVKNPPASRK